MRVRHRCHHVLNPVFTKSQGQAMELTAVFRKDDAGGFVAFVEALPGANTQGETLEEARENLREAVALIIESNRFLAEQAIGNAEVIRERLSA